MTIPTASELPDLPSEEARPTRWRRSRAALVTLVVAVTGGIFLAVGAGLIFPAYKWPTSASYGTAFGYPALLRRLGKPIPVKTALAERRRLAKRELAEGTMASDPVLVPMVPIARIVAVYVQPGQHVAKGDLLAELDSRKGRRAAEAARLGFESAKAELRRVQIGSVYSMTHEQPGKDAIDVDALKSQVDLLHEETAMKQKLFDQGLLSKDQLLESQRLQQEAQRSLDAASLSLRLSAPGRSQSEKIAANAMQQAALQWEDALTELNDYKIVAPADGIVDRVLIHPGEFNQVSGSPAVVLAAGLWFQAYFDQSALGDMNVGQEAEVRLAARPESTFKGHVANVNSIVSYSTGGPEARVPLRPSGTSGPEWPATFQVRIALDSSSADLVPGMTGFARVTSDRYCIAVPEAAMVSMSAGSGLLYAVNDSGPSGAEWEVRQARYGTSFDGWLEVLDGAKVGESFIIEGQRVLEPGDAIVGRESHASIRR